MSMRYMIEEFHKLEEELHQRAEDMQIKRELLLAQKEGEMVRPSVWMMDSWSAADFISQKEDTIAKNKREKSEIDLSIVNMHATLTSLQLNKLSPFLNKLKVLCNKNPQQICPAEYTMEQYEELLKCDPQIAEKQSEILESLRRKVRLIQEYALDEEYHVLERGSSVYRFDMKKEFERLQQKKYWKSDEQSVVDKELFEYVRGLLKLNGNNFEALKLREFIDQCNKKPVYGEEASASSQIYQSFICAMTQYICTKYDTLVSSTDADPTTRLDQIYSQIEEIVFPQVEKAIEMQIVNQDDNNITLDQKYKIFADIDQQSLGIKEKFLDKRFYPHCKAITEIMKINVVSTPTQKLKQILKAAHEILRYMNSLCEDSDMVPGADEFMDIWIFVLLKARLSKFFTTVALLRDYSNPRIKLSEFGYYMASFELGGEYIRTLSDDFRSHQFTSSHRVPGEVFFTPELSRCRKFIDTGAFFVVKDEFLLEGFRLVIDYDLQLENTARLFTSFVKKDPQSRVFGSLISCHHNSKINSEWIKSQMNKFSKMTVMRNFQGINILMQNERETSMSPDSHRYIGIPSGRYEDYSNLLKSHLSAERLGYLNQSTGNITLNLESCKERIITVDELLRGSWSLFLDDYCGGDSQDIYAVLCEKVKDIQVRLRSVQCYSKLLPISGMYDKATCSGIERFQKMCNETLYGKDDVHLDVNGICDSRTLECLRECKLGH